MKPETKASIAGFFGSFFRFLGKLALFGVCLALIAGIGYGTRWLVLNAAEEPTLDSPADHSAALFRRGDLNPDILKGNALEVLLNDKLKHVVASAGIRAGDFGTSVSVHMIKGESNPPSPDDVDAADDGSDDDALAERKPTGIDADIDDTAANKTNLPFFSDYQGGSLFSADTLLRHYRKDLEEDRKLDRFKASLMEQADGTDEPANQRNVYLVDHVHMHVSLSDRYSDSLASDVEEAVKNSFAPMFGDHFTFEVQQGVQFTHPWILSSISAGVSWFEKFQTFALLALVIASLLAALVIWRIVPSWRAKFQDRKVQRREIARESKFALEAAQKKEEALRAIEEAAAQAKAEEEARPLPPPAPTDAEVAAAKSAEEERILRGRAGQLEKKILGFAQDHSGLVARVLQGWSQAKESEELLLKINLAIEFFASNRIQIGKVEFRPEVLDELRRTKRKAAEIPLKARVDALDEIFWDLVSGEHLTHESKPNTLSFVNSIDDQTVFAAMRRESPEIQAMILMSLTEKRAAHMMSKLSAESRKKVLSHLFASENEAMSLDEAKEIASRVQAGINAAIAEKEMLGASQGLDSFLPILYSLDFESQFAAARGLLALPTETRNQVCRNYFNVGMLPATQKTFLEKIFVDRPTNMLKAALSQFDTVFTERVRELLPPMQQRMLEGNLNDGSVTKAEAFEALKTLNQEVLGKIGKSELSFSDIFSFEENAPTGEVNEIHAA